MHVSHSFSTSLMADQRGLTNINVCLYQVFEDILGKWNNHDPNRIAPINGDEFTSVLACQSYFGGELSALQKFKTSQEGYLILILSCRH
jgi:hypothetical protein